ncbi:hypothetical protein DSO57_1016257 [Entomophthora muscae]|uniref:Uncharacterized protein n=1 Tax=Entomophthora muscae TaxID=34485 RepID=A0ACC2RW26_9FUNG|nr:hypothetical protein DSO57_1016257 [Entomophthora muscae]
MKLMIEVSLPLLGALITPPFGVLIPLVWLALPFSSAFLASACGGATSGKRGQATCGDSGSGFKFHSWTQVSRRKELTILTKFNKILIHLKPQQDIFAWLFKIGMKTKGDPPKETKAVKKYTEISKVALA